VLQERALYLQMAQGILLKRKRAYLGIMHEVLAGIAERRLRACGDELERLDDRLMHRVNRENGGEMTRISFSRHYSCQDRSNFGMRTVLPDPFEPDMTVRGL